MYHFHYKHASYDPLLPGSTLSSPAPLKQSQRGGSDKFFLCCGSSMWHFEKKREKKKGIKTKAQKATSPFFSLQTAAQEALAITHSHTQSTALPDEQLAVPSLSLSFSLCPWHSPPLFPPTYSSPLPQLLSVSPSLARRLSDKMHTSPLSPCSVFSDISPPHTSCSMKTNIHTQTYSCFVIFCLGSRQSTENKWWWSIHILHDYSSDSMFNT